MLGKILFLCNTAALSHQCNAVLAESTEQSQRLHTDALHSVGLLCIYIYTHTYAHTNICMWRCVYICVCVCVYICIYICPGLRSQESLVQFQRSALCRQAGSRHGRGSLCHLDSSHSTQGKALLVQKKSDVNYVFVIQKQPCFEGCFLFFACPCKPR